MVSSADTYTPSTCYERGAEDAGIQERIQDKGNCCMIALTTVFYIENIDNI